MMNKKILKAQLSLLFIIGPFLFSIKDLKEPEILQLKRQKKFGITSLFCLIVLGVLFYFSSQFINMPEVFFITSFALPAYMIYHLTMVIIGYTEIKKNGIFIFPFIK